MPLPSATVNRARSLRRTMTEAERRLWSALRAHRLGPLHFRRQTPFGPFIADFCCKSARVIVEVDGGQHGQPDRRSRDEARDLWLAAQGYLTLRFTNAEVFTALELVKETIFWRCYERLPDGHPVKLP